MKKVSQVNFRKMKKVFSLFLYVYVCFLVFFHFTHKQQQQQSCLKREKLKEKFFKSLLKDEK